MKMKPETKTGDRLLVFFTKLTFVLACIGLALGTMVIVGAVLSDMGILLQDPSVPGPRPSFNSGVILFIISLALGTLSEISKTLRP